MYELILLCSPSSTAERNKINKGRDDLTFAPGKNNQKLFFNNILITKKIYYLITLKFYHYLIM